MALTVSPPLERAARTVRSGLLTTFVRAEGNRSVVVLRGEADLSARPALSDVLSRVIAERTGDVVVDLAEVEFVDSTTVHALAVAQEFLDRQGRKLRIRSPSRLAVRVLEVFGLSDLIESREGAEL
jgi:anti-sigma B factor antagonist